MVAEDEYILGDVIQEELSERGASVHWVQDGQQTIDAIGKQAPDLLLLDLLMPSKNGYDVLQFLATEGCNFPVVILSNLTDLKERDKCLALGAKDFLVKGDLDPEDIWELVKRYLA